LATRIAILNQKGGVAKTTTAINLSSGLAKKGYSVLLVDFDPQANATYGLGIAPEADIPTISSILEEEHSDISSIFLDIEENLKLAPANILLANTAQLLHFRNFKEYVLQRALAPVDAMFNYIIIDCQPSLEVLPVNALVASNRCLVPTGLDPFSLVGFANLLATIDGLKGDDNNFDYRVLPTKVTAVYEETQLQAIKALKPVQKRILKTQIALNISISRSQMGTDHQTPTSVLNVEARSQGAKDYRALVKELVNIWPPHLNNELKT